MSGLSPEWLKFDEEVFAKHFDDISTLSEFAEINNGATTHPIIALRVKALVLFSQSRLYIDWIGQPAASLTTDDLEKSVDYMLSVVEPDLTSIESASEDKAANSLLVHGALVIVASDGVLDPTEASFIRNKGVNLTPELEEGLKAPDFVQKTLEWMRKDAQILTHKLSIVDRAGLLHQMCLVAAAAGGIVTGELDVVIALAKMLEVPPKILGSILESAKSSTPAPAKPKKKRAPRKKKTEKLESTAVPVAAPPDSKP